MNSGAIGKYAVDFEARVDYSRMRKERLQRAKDHLSTNGMGALLTWDVSDMRYLTSHWLPTSLWNCEIEFVFCARNGEPHLFCGGTPEETERRMPWMKGRIHPTMGIPKIASNNADDVLIGNIVDVIGKLMSEYGVQDECLGIAGSTLQMLYAKAFEKKGIKVVHGKPAMDAARMIKTSDEIELMRITCANSEKVFATIVDAIRPGVRECDLVGIAMKVLYEEGDDHTEDLVCCSGYNTNPFSWRFTDKPIRSGELIYIDVDGCSYQGYRSCVYRTFCCGKATQEQKDLYEECRAMLYAGMSAVKDGAIDYDILEKWPNSPKYWGFETWHEVIPYAVGHGIGLTLHDRPLISMVTKASGYPATTLKEGMCLALETWVGRKGGKDGVRLEEDLVVTKDGYELLTRWPIAELMEVWLPYR